MNRNTELSSTQTELDLKAKLQECYYLFVLKENEMLHYRRYIFALNQFEEFIKKSNLLEQAFIESNMTLEKFNYSKDKLESYGKSLQGVTCDLSYRSYYENFEEFLSKILISLYTFFPVFLKKETDSITLHYDNIFTQVNINDLRESFIEKKVKDIIQSSNILNVLKKLKIVFGIDILLEDDDCKLLMYTSLNRNIITHNNGIINSIYLESIKKYKIDKEHNLGENIHLNLHEYLSECQNLIPKIGEKIFNQISAKTTQLEKYANSLS